MPSQIGGSAGINELVVLIRIGTVGEGAFTGLPAVAQDATKMLRANAKLYSTFLY